MNLLNPKIQIIKFQIPSIKLQTKLKSQCFNDQNIVWDFEFDYYYFFEICVL